MSINQNIITWLSDLHDSLADTQVQSHSPYQLPLILETTPASQTRKRKATQGPSPPPTISKMGDPETPTHKRQRLFLATDPDLTPRPDPTRASSVSSSSASGRSRSSSPLKRQFLELRLDATGVETRALTVDGLMAIPNPEAASLLRIIRRISAYRGFLPDRLRDEILQNHNIEESDMDDWDSAFKDSSAFDDLPGRIPSPAEIRLINEWTIECIEFKHEEAGWNDEVHFPLLKAIFREPGEKNGGLFNITTCHTARPHKSWLPKSIGSKMVDFCVYADTAFKDNVSLQTHEAFCRSTLTKSVNHTEFHRLQIRPIVLSIETKAGSHNLDEAELQVGVWHASQWAFLRSSLISLKRASMTGPPTQQELEQADQALATLQFIPAVIVQGSRWLFVLSTRQGQKTVLWKEWQFGSTATAMETYQVVAGLRQLTAWADKVYLPWFQKEILAYYEPSIK